MTSRFAGPLDFAHLLVFRTEQNISENGFVSFPGKKGSVKKFTAHEIKRLDLLQHSGKRKNFCIPAEIPNHSAMLPPTIQERFLCLEVNIF
jgi:hypothetical protein